MEEKLIGIIEANKKYLEQGEVANYIPALAKANKNHIGVCLIDKDKIYKAGDCDVKFTIQSISKVVSLMRALMDNGEEFVFDRVGYEGTEEPFNTLYKLGLENVTKPTNPMINSGAILTTSLVNGNGDEKFKRILELMKKISKNDKLTYNEEVYISESETGDRNKAMGRLMKARGMLEGNVDEILDSYFKQCSIEVTTLDIANIANFIANGCVGLEDYGKIDKKRLTKVLLSVMNNCGMYNFSSQYGVNVGIPSKSGVGGGIMASVPGKCGIGVFSPGLDENGNSKVGYEILKDMSEEFDLSIY